MSFLCLFGLFVVAILLCVDVPREPGWPAYHDGLRKPHLLHQGLRQVNKSATKYTSKVFNHKQFFFSVLSYILSLTF